MYVRYRSAVALCVAIFWALFTPGTLVAQQAYEIGELVTLQLMGNQEITGRVLWKDDAQNLILRERPGQLPRQIPWGNIQRRIPLLLPAQQGQPNPWAVFDPDLALNKRILAQGQLPKAQKQLDDQTIVSFKFSPRDQYYPPEIYKFTSRKGTTEESVKYIGPYLSLQEKALLAKFQDLENKVTFLEKTRDSTLQLVKSQIDVQFQRNDAESRFYFNQPLSNPYVHRSPYHWFPGGSPYHPYPGIYVMGNYGQQKNGANGAEQIKKTIELSQFTNDKLFEVRDDLQEARGSYALHLNGQLVAIRTWQ